MQEWRLEPYEDETGRHYRYVAVPPKIRLNDDPSVIEVYATDRLEPVARYSRGGIVGPRPEPLVCDCGHPDAVHSKHPGIGCTNRPYCLCVHPTGQRVPHVRVSFA